MILDLPLADTQTKIDLRSRLKAIGGAGAGDFSFNTGKNFFSILVNSSFRRKIELEKIEPEPVETLIIKGRGSNLIAQIECLEEGLPESFKEMRLISHEFYSNSDVYIDLPCEENLYLDYLCFQAVTSVELELQNAGLRSGYPPIKLLRNATLKNLGIPLYNNSRFFLHGGGLLDGTLIIGILKGDE